MNLDRHPAGESIHFLKQGIELIGQLDDRLFTQCPGGPFRGGAGSQFRHCLDFYSSLLAGLPGGRIDYSARERDSRLETERDHAIRTTESLIDRLLELRPEQLATSLQVRADFPTLGDEGDAWSGSTLHRELQFLLSHTVHHYALIASLLKPQGFDVAEQFPDFGVAPSTLAHWKQADLAEV